jgi:hypothetical protein
LRAVIFFSSPARSGGTISFHHDVAWMIPLGASWRDYDALGADRLDKEMQAFLDWLKTAC